MELASNAACVLLVLDLEVDENWRAAVAFLRRRVPSIPIVGYSRLPEVDLWLDALEAGMNDFICKPFYTHEIAWILQNTAHSLELFPAAFQAA
jgi:PleD family two-component response regulator